MSVWNDGFCLHVQVIGRLYVESCHCIVAISMCTVAVKQNKLIQCELDVCIYVYVKCLRTGVVANLLSDACSLS